MKRNSPTDDRLNVLGAAIEAGCSTSTIERRIKAGDLRAERRFGRWTILRADLEAMLALEAKRPARGAA